MTNDPVPTFSLKALTSDRRTIALFAVVAIVLFVVGGLASEVLEGESFAIDRTIMLALRTPGHLAQPIGPGWLPAVMRDISAFGGVTGLTMITLLAAGSLMATRNPRTAGFVIVAISAGAILASWLKTVFLRPRPDLVPHLVDVSNASFPSGHAMNSAIVYLILAALVARTQQDRDVRLYVQAAAIALTLVVGVSRVYLGVHWPSDVVAGWCVGALWAMLCSMVFHRVIAPVRHVV